MLSCAFPQAMERVHCIAFLPNLPLRGLYNNHENSQDISRHMYTGLQQYYAYKFSHK